MDQNLNNVIIQQESWGEEDNLNEPSIGGLFMGKILDLSYEKGRPAGNLVKEFVSLKGIVVNVYEECLLGTCNCEYFIGSVKKQLKPCRFASAMLAYGVDEDDEYREFLSFILEGFPIVDSQVPSYCCENYNSILEPENKALMDNIVERELEEGSISFSLEEPTCVHSLGAVPKAGGGIRHITDCSRPQDISVNNFCKSLLKNFTYKSVDDVVCLLKGREFMSVIDIKSAYRAVPIREDHRRYMGFKWEMHGVLRTFTDNRLCFGLRLGPQIFDRISCFIYDVLSNVVGIKVVNYLDDFIVIADTYIDCVHSQGMVLQLLRYLGFHVSYEKLLSPSTCTTYLGLEVDSVAMELRLPPKKLAKLISLLEIYVSKDRISKHDLESLGGLLSHCSHVVRGGRIFCRQIYDLYKTMIHRKKKYLKIPNDARQDILWWREFCVIFNGKSPINNTLFSHPMVSDSSLMGYGVYLGADWSAGSWNGKLGYNYA